MSARKRSIRITAAILAAILLLSCAGCTKKVQHQPAGTLQPSETGPQEEASSTPAGSSEPGAETPGSSAAPSGTASASETPDGPSAPVDPTPASETPDGPAAPVDPAPGSETPDSPAAPAETEAPEEPVLVVPGEAAAAELRASAEEYGFENALSELKPVSENTVDGDVFLRLQQYYNGIRVYGRSVVQVNGSDGDPAAAVGNLLDVSGEIDLAQTLSEEKIRNACADYFGEADSGDGVSVLRGASETSRYIYNLFGHEACLAYEVMVFRGGALYNAVISCPDGEVLLCTPCQVADTAGSGQTVLCSGTDIDENPVEFSAYRRSEEDPYILFDLERNLIVYDAGGETVYSNFAFSDPDGERYHTVVTVDPENGRKNKTAIRESDGQAFSLDELQYNPNSIQWNLSKEESGGSVEVSSSATRTWSDSDAATAMHRTELVYDFYQSVLNRSGFDGKGNRMYILIHNLDARSGGAYSSTPYKSGPVTMISFCDRLALDTFAHEYTHSVEASESGMVYQNESGALMEALSDLFGELAEDYVNDGMLNGNCNWVHGERSLISPQDHGYPDTYQGEYWGETYTDEKDLEVEENDHGHVHTNNTVISHAAYLMCDVDGTHPEKLSPRELAKLWYRAMLMMPSDCDFQKCRTLVETAAQTMALRSEQIACIGEAFDKVGIRDDDQAFDFVVGPGSALLVLDRNGAPYADYSCEITGTLSKRAGLGERSYAQSFPDNTADPLPLPDREGSYTAVITDKNDDTVSISFRLKVDPREEAQTIRIPTSFGTSSTDAVPMDWLTSQWFEKSIQYVQAFRFYPDGVVEQYYYDYIQDPTFLSAEEHKYGLYLENTGTYSVDRDELNIRINDGDPDYSYEFTVRYLRKADHPEVTNWDTAYGIPEDKWFFYEYGFEHHYEDDGYYYDNAQYLEPRESLAAMPVFGGRMDNTSADFTATLVTDAYYAEDPQLDENGNPDGREYNIPQINLQSPEIDQLNQSIFDALYPDIKTSVDAIREGSYPLLDYVTYEYARTGDILSVWVRSHYYYEYSELNAYTVSVSQKRVLSREELLEAYGIPENDYRDQAKRAMVSRYLDSADRNLGPEDFYQEQLNKTADDANIDAAVPFLDHNGQLCIIGRVYSLVAADSYPCIINLETFVLSPEYERWFGEGGTGRYGSLPEPYASFLANEEYKESSYGEYVNGYCLLDIDQDGTEELFLSAPEMFGQIFLIYAYDRSAGRLREAGVRDGFNGLSYSPGNRTIVSGWRDMDNGRYYYSYNVSQLIGVELETVANITYDTENDSYSGTAPDRTLSEAQCKAYLSDLEQIRTLPLEDD